VATTRDISDRLHSGALHLVRRVRTVDAETGISAPRLAVLAVLVFGGPRTIGELASVEQVRQPTMTSLVNGLEADGLAVRRDDPDDGRRRVEMLDALLAGLPERDLRTLDRAADLLEQLAFNP
jgi:DNA-binding transcriptional ArsR family regulator